MLPLSLRSHLDVPVVPAIACEEARGTVSVRSTAAGFPVMSGDVAATGCPLSSARAQDRRVARPFVLEGAHFLPVGLLSTQLAIPRVSLAWARSPRATRSSTPPSDSSSSWRKRPYRERTESASRSSVTESCGRSRRATPRSLRWTVTSTSPVRVRAWPRPATFVPEAIQQGIKSILSTPLIPGDRPVGALNIYSDAERAFGTSQHELAQLFATQASGILADAGAHVADDERTALLTDSLRSREVIAVAQGVLMERTGVTQDDAAGVLRRESRTAGVTVRQHAGDVVRSTQGDTPATSDG